MKLFRCAALLLAGLVWAFPARAQAADTAAITSALWTACPGATIRVTVGSEAPVVGRCGVVVDGRLRVDVQGVERQIALVDVDSLWVRRSLKTEATVVFSLLGVGVGAWFANSLGIDDCAFYGCNSERLSETLTGGGIGGVVGAGVGLVSGSLITRWRRRHP